MAKKSNKKMTAVAKEMSLEELKTMAHLGTKEAMVKIEKYIKEEKDFEKREYAKIALEECEFLFHQPTNEREEEEFLLCKLIQQREENIDNLTMKMEKLELILEKSALEGKVHEKVLAKNKSKKENWQYNWMPDFAISEAQELEKIKESIAYDKAWIAEAKKMITIAKYKNMPERCLKHFSFGLDENFLGDNNFDSEACDDENCDCNCGDNCEGDNCDCDDSCDCDDKMISEVPF